MATVNRATLMKFRKSHAVIIGIDDYSLSVGPLSTPVADAQRFKDILIREQGFLEEDIHFLADPDKAAIEQMLEEIKNSGGASEEDDEDFDISKKDCLVFYYAGHGLAGDLPEEGEEKGPAGYLLPADASLQTAKLSENPTLIKMEQVFEALDQMDAHHTLLILDCCFAGTFRRVNQTRGQLGLANRPMTLSRFDRYKKKRAWQVLASAGPAEKAADWIGERGDDSTDRKGQGKLRARHSPFALALFQALGGINRTVDVKPAGKGLGDGIITSSELFLYLHDQVESITRKDADFKPQNPSLFPLGKDDGGQFIFIDPRHPRNDPDWATLRRANPYKGLEQFDIVDNPFYYGREKEIEKVLEAIKFGAEEKGPPILMVTGSSGSGKSSFIKAGILSKFEALENEEGEEKQKTYELFQLRPGNKPWTITKYEEGEWKSAFEPAASLFELEGDEAPTLLGEGSPLDPNAKQILLIDQYEELFTTCTETEREALETALIELLNQSLQENGQLQLFITIRSDFEWKLEISTLGQFYWNERNTYYHLCRLHALGLDQLRDVLINPALVLAYDFEEKDQTNLVDVILDDLDYLPSALPLLSYCMKLLADETSKVKRTFLIDTYNDEIGGVAGAMQKRLADIYQDLSPEEQGLMQQIILRMVNLSDGEYTRRRLFRSPGLDELGFTSIPTEDVTALIEKLVEAQLIYVDEMADIPFVELVHDSLINTGSTCRLWIQEFGRENLLLQRQLWGAVQEFQRKGEDTAFLWDNNPKIVLLKAILDGDDSWFNALELDFVEKSWGRRIEEIARVKRQRDEAWATALAARAQQYSFQDVTHGLRIAEGAYQWTPEPLLSAKQSLVRTYYDGLSKGTYRTILSRHQGQIWSMAISEDGHTLATGGQDGRILLWNTTSGQLIREIDNDEANFMGFPSPIRSLVIESDVQRRAEFVISGNDQGKARIWRVADGVLVHKKEYGSIFSSTWAINRSPDGKYLGVGGTNGGALVWKPNDEEWGRKIVLGFASTAFINALAFSPDHEYVWIIASDGTLKKFRLNPWEVVKEVELDHSLNAAAFSTDMNFLLTGGLNKEVQLWDLLAIDAAPQTNHVPLRSYAGHSGHINALSFTEDHGVFLSGSSDQTAILWDRETGRELQRFQVPNSSVQVAVVAPDRSFVVTGGHDGFGRIWDTAGEEGVYLGHELEIDGLSVSKDGSRMLTFGAFYDSRDNKMNRELKIWDRESRGVFKNWDDKKMGQFLHQSNHYLTLQQASGLIEQWDEAHQRVKSFQGVDAISMAISHNDEHLLLGTERGEIFFYELSSGTQVGEPFSRGNSRVNSLAFSIDGKRFAAGERDSIGATLWDIEARNFVSLEGHSKHVMAVAFSKDGNVLMTGSWDSTISIWDANSGTHKKTYETGKLVSTLAISNDSRYFLTSQWDESVVLRSLETGDIIGVYEGHSSFINGLAFDPEDHIIYSAGKDRTLRTWLTPKGIHQKLKAMPLYELTEDEEDTYGLNQSFE